MNDLLSILIVNYKSADLLRDCLKSVAWQGVPCEVIIVDNDSGDHDRQILESFGTLFSFTKVLFNEKNEGFSKANNRAYDASRGDYVLFLNPDTLLFPLCLERLISFLKSKADIGCAIPKLWMDKKRQFLLPPSFLPSFNRKLQDLIICRNRRLFEFHQRSWLRKALSYWNSELPLAAEAISGAFFMTTREVLKKIGVFDERFSLYFEDSDLCRRIKEAGLDIYYYPAAEAVHLYNQSAKKSTESQRKFVASERLYMEKYYSRGLAGVVSFLDRFAGGGAAVPAAAKRDFFEPITTSAGYLLFSPLATLIPCAAHETAIGQFTFDRDFIGSLAPGRYYAALLEPPFTLKETFALEKP